MTWDFGSKFSPAAVNALAQSQTILPSFLINPDSPTVPVSGQRLGGGEGLAIAQSRCPWWIEGMLLLLQAIEDAPEPEAWQRRRGAHAHNAVANALREGRLVRQPCEVCGRAEAVQAHHDDYSKPLDVHWLCMDHHKAHHAALGTYADNGKAIHGPRRRLTGHRSEWELARNQELAVSA